MPGNVRNVSALAVLPPTLCSAFSEARDFRAREGEYADGSSQRSSEATVSQKRFKLTNPLTAAQWLELRSFYVARRSGSEAFYFYFGLETVPLFNHDPTGQNATGRYTVRLDGEFLLELGVGLLPANLMLVEIA